MRNLLLQAYPDVPYHQIILLLLGMIAFIVIGMIVVSHLKRWLKETGSEQGPGFTLSDLRQLHKQGQISDEEFEKAKAMAIQAARKAAERETPKPEPHKRPELPE
jgi:hypothetical protein